MKLVKAYFIFEKLLRTLLKFIVDPQNVNFNVAHYIAKFGGNSTNINKIIVGQSCNWISSIFNLYILRAVYKWDHGVPKSACTRNQ